MRAVPLFRQKAMFKYWILEFDCRFRKFDTCPLRDVLDKSIWMLGKSPMSKDREDGGLVGGKYEGSERGL